MNLFIMPTWMSLRSHGTTEMAFTHSESVMTDVRLQFLLEAVS